MINLIKILENNIQYKINKEKTNQIGTLSGSNALMFDGYNFEAEDSDNCPRIALLRRVGNLQSPRQLKNYLSNTHGRLFEDLLRDMLKINSKQNQFVEFLEEEEVEVFIEDDSGNKLISARPDKILKINNQIIPVEVKTIQSNSTAYKIFIKEQPKLGALMQLALYLYGHNTEKGLLLYCASNWFGGFAGRTRWSVEPNFKIFEVELKNSHIYYNNIKSSITIDKIIQGSYKFIDCKKNNKLPSIPRWINVHDEPASYSGCTYCSLKNSCEKEKSLTLQEFFNHAKEIYAREETKTSAVRD